MESIRSIQDESVRKLAETLKQSGLAASETEAIRMASSMTNTNSKVQQTFEDRKDKTIMGLSHLNKEYPKRNEDGTVRQAEQETTSEATHRSTSSFQRKEDHSGFIEREIKKEMISNEEGHEEFIEQEIVNSAVEMPKVQERPLERPIFREQTPNQPETQVQNPVRAPPKRNIADMEESKIDLSDVFNFSK